MTPTSRTDPPPSEHSFVEEPPLHPPTSLLVGAGVAVGVSTLLLLVNNRVSNILGYLLATFVTVLCVSFYRSIDGRRRARPTYTVTTLVQVLPTHALTWVLLVAGLFVGGVHVWWFAESVART